MGIIEIDRIDAPELMPYSQLTETQLRNRLEPEKGLFIAESPKVIRIAIEAGYEPLSLLAERKHLEGDAQDIMGFCAHVPVYTASHEVLSGLTGFELTRGVLCAMRRPQAKTLDDVCRNASRIAVLDGVVNATNTGAIFRAAAAMGIDGIVLTHTCCDALNRRSVRVSMGTVFQLPWCYGTGELADIAAELRGQGFCTLALALSDNSKDIDDAELKTKERIAIVLGTEGDGLSTEAKQACNYVVKIPMHRGVDSLNVAAAASVAFWELRAR